MMDGYKIVAQIGEGAHGLIFSGLDVHTDRQVALKKIFVKKLEQGIPKQILREIKSMQAVDSKYVMRLHNYFAHGASIVLVFDLMPSGLSEMIYDKETSLTEAQMKAYSLMLIKGVTAIHSNNIMHRDLKPANLLISSEGILKIGDFGLARLKWEGDLKGRPYTHQVATRWYRAPELLYGAKRYTEAVDLWAVGAIIAEMYLKQPLFKGETDIDQLAIVVNSLGSPSEKVWPGVSKLPDYGKIIFPSVKPLPWTSLLPNVPSTAIDLIASFIKYDASSRLPADKAINHPYFTTTPAPCPEAQMPRPPSDHRESLKRREHMSRLKQDVAFIVASPVQELISSSSTITG